VPPVPEQDIYIAIGSNVEPLRHIPAALAALDAVCGPLVCSPAYRSHPVGFEGPDFVNCVVRGRASQSPEELTARFKALEQLAGRRRRPPNSSRELDLDLALYGDAVIRREGITIPRPDVLGYAFVLRPLAELAPQARHPETGRSFAWHWEHFRGERIALERVALPDPPRVSSPAR